MINGCGWTNGSTFKIAKSRTNGLVLAAIGELQELPPLPTAFICDLNADVCGIQGLNHLHQKRAEAKILAWLCRVIVL